MSEFSKRLRGAWNKDQMAGLVFDAAGHIEKQDARIEVLERHLAECERQYQEQIAKVGVMLDALMRIIEEGSGEGGPTGSDGERMVWIAKDALGIPY